MKKEDMSKKGLKPYSSSSTPITSWSCSRIKDPRIVGVSRAFGRKDRHSKVCTVKGLRDRRVRLSIPTAIQLYDLQDRLGLSQPSKVVEWLMNAAKKDIDKLPPLQIPPGSFVSPSFQTTSDKLGGFRTSGSYWPYVTNSNLTYRQDQMNHGACINSNSSFLRWDSSNLSLSHPSSSKEEDWHNLSILHLQQSLIYHHQPYFATPTTLRFALEPEPEPERATTQFNMTQNLENVQSKDHDFLTR